MIEVNAVGYDDDQLYDRALEVALELGFELSNKILPRLLLTGQGLALKTANFSLLYPEFHAPFWNKRRQEGKKQGLVRSCKPAAGLKIVDATAGWGRDAAILASFGAEVLMLERNPVMAALIQDGLQRPPAAQRLPLTFRAVDSLSYLQNIDLENYPDIIYIDPMHPQRSKSALVKKDMQILQQLIGTDHDAAVLIELARSRCKNRVVVKWPAQEPALIQTADFIAGKTVRFDIYKAS